MHIFLSFCGRPKEDFPILKVQWTENQIVTKTTNGLKQSVKTMEPQDGLGRKGP